MNVGFIGLGAMGWPMAANLTRANHKVTAFDIDPDRTAAFAGEFGAVAQPGLDSAWDCEIVISMLPTGQIVRDAMSRANIASGTLVIDMSSSEPAGTRELGAELAARGIALIDAPVSGGVAGAASGGLTIMVGCDDPALLEKARPVLEVLGARIFETGGLGSGHAIKSLNNYVTAASYIATSEAVIVGKRFGLDPATMIEIMNVSTGRNFHTDITFKHHVLTETFATGFALGLASKDVGIADGLADAVYVAAPPLRLSRERLTSALDTLGQGADISAAIKAWDK
ncbi:hypothetical protein BH09PSE4_BH09PSE4_00390 [soil metagenome]